MTKILYSFFAVLGLVAFAACSDDNDNPYGGDAAVKVTESDLFFSPEVSEGKVAYTASGSVTAESAASWCRAVMDGDTVRVSVEQNNSIQSRATTVVLRCGADSTVVPVLQEGISVLYSKDALVLDNNTGDEVSCHLSTNIAVKLLSSPDWADVRIENDSIKAVIAANTTGRMRTGYVRIVTEDGAYADSIKISQYDFDENIAGSYKFYYYSESGRLRSMNATVTEDAISLSSLSIPYTFDKERLAFGVVPVCNVGRVSGNYIYLTFLSESGSVIISHDESLTNYAPLTYSDSGELTATFEGTSLSGMSFNIFYFIKFATDNFSTESNEGILYSWYNPYLVKNN